MIYSYNISLKVLYYSLLLQHSIKWIGNTMFYATFVPHLQKWRFFLRQFCEVIIVKLTVLLVIEGL